MTRTDTLGDVDDLISVRPDETFDISSLEKWLVDVEGLPAGRPSVTQFGGGKANLTYLLSFPDGQELVLRRPPLGPVPENSHDMVREYRVLSRLWQAFDKAPKAVALCEDAGVIGSPFFLMERKTGVVVRGRVPEQFGGGADPVNNRKLATAVIDTLAEFHGVDPSSCQLVDLGHPDGYVRRQVEGWQRRWQKARHQDDAVADEVAEWLLSHLPPESVPTLVHNDWRLDNMAVSPTNPGVAVAVYDWDMATRGDPLTDLGTLMGSWFDPGEAPETLSMMPTTTTGWISRADAVARYGDVSGRDLEHIEWYLVFGSWKLGVILQQIYIRWLRGQTRDDRFAELGDGAALLFRLASERRS